MVTINSSNEPTAVTGKVLQGQGVGTTSNFSTATYPSTATGTGTILRADGTNWSATTATYPATTSANTMVISTSANVVTTTTFIAATSFTPVLAFGGASVGITYTTQYGRYTRIGDCIIFVVYLLLSNKGSSTGSATITGLPVASAATGTYNFFMDIFNGGAAGSTYFTANLGAAATTLGLFFVLSTAGTSTALPETNFNNTSAIRIQGSYFV